MGEGEREALNISLKLSANSAQTKNRRQEDPLQTKYSFGRVIKG
jgi:hypothetical protein